MKKVKKKLIYYFFKLPKVLKYKFLSNNENTEGEPILNQAIQLNGKGKIIFGNNNYIGIDPSPFLYSGYCYFEARNLHSSIKLGNDIFINNNCVIISEGEGIEISSNCLIGTNCEIYDSDFHSLDPNLRLDISSVKTSKVILQKNVFLGSNVKILKGVTIGENSVISNGSIVVKDIPKNVVAGGIPAKIIKKL